MCGVYIQKTGNARFFGWLYPAPIPGTLLEISAGVSEAASPFWFCLINGR